MKSLKYSFVALFLVVSLASCSSARKAKKCGCPTFGMHQSHSNPNSSMVAAPSDNTSY